jgi:octanoyl-[GcvH]:protein N-octanoyltransferase
MSTEPLQLITTSWHGRPAFDTAVSRALMLRVAGGDLPGTLRLYRPERIVAFGGADVRSEGFGTAVERARGTGFESVVRLAGGRAAVFHEGTLAFARAVADRDPTARTFARFEEMSQLLAAALRRLGVDARVGEVPGEYCPGEYSINARGRTKLVGIGQRIVSGASHTGGVIVATGSDDVRGVLVPVYDALGLDWDPAATGSVTDEVGVTWDEVFEAVVAGFSERFEIVEGEVDPSTLALAAKLEPDHDPATFLPGKRDP